jgi:hypothetical protein
MRQPEHEADYSPTPIAKEYGNLNLQFSRHSAYSLEKLAV